MTPRDQFDMLLGCKIMGLTIAETARKLDIREQYVRGAAHTLGLTFRSAAASTKPKTAKAQFQRTGRKVVLRPPKLSPFDPAPPAGKTRRLPDRHYRPFAEPQ